MLPTSIKIPLLWSCLVVLPSFGESCESSDTSSDAHSPAGVTEIEGANSGLSATYFGNIDFTGATIQRVDPVVDFD